MSLLQRASPSRLHGASVGSSAKLRGGPSRVTIKVSPRMSLAMRMRWSTYTVSNLPPHTASATIHEQDPIMVHISARYIGSNFQILTFFQTRKCTTATPKNKDAVTRTPCQCSQGTRKSTYMQMQVHKHALVQTCKHTCMHRIDSGQLIIA